jgi:hypothetical protein
MNVVCEQEDSELFQVLTDIILDANLVRSHRRDKNYPTRERLDDISDRIEELQVFMAASEVCVVPMHEAAGTGWIHSWAGCVKSRRDAQHVIFMLTSRARAALYSCAYRREASFRDMAKLHIEAVS